MDTKELRTQSAAALNETLTNLLKEHFELRMQHQGGQLKDHTKLGKIKRNIARVKTIMQEK